MMNLEYNWLASFASLGLTLIIVAMGRWIVFKIPAIKETQQKNKQVDKTKYKNERYQPRIKTSQRIGLGTNLFFFIFIAPFFITLETQSIGRILLNVVVILLVYDFFYYLTHRFLFHGNGRLRKVHAVHHQARRPTTIDSYLLHPAEAFIGIGLYVITIVSVSLAMGGPFDVASIVLTMVIYTQLNQINHVHIDLHYFPFNTLSWIADRHAAHHVDMHRGNYSTITLLYDKLFGTFE